MNSILVLSMTHQYLGHTLLREESAGPGQMPRRREAGCPQPGAGTAADVQIGRLRLERRRRSRRSSPHLAEAEVAHALPPGGPVAGRGGDVAPGRGGPAGSQAVRCRTAPAGRGPDPGPWRRLRRRARRGGTRPGRRRRRQQHPSGAAGVAYCAAGTWRPRRWAAATTRCATAAPPRCGCCASSGTALCVARSCAR